MNFELIKSGISVTSLLASLERKPHLWQEITKRQSIEGSPHHYTQSIFLRWAESLDVHAAFNDLVAVNYPALEALPEADQLIDEIAEAINPIMLGRCLIVSLAPGGVIDPHPDEGNYAASYQRFHLPLQSDPGNIFRSHYALANGVQVEESVHMKPGQLWNFNHRAVHSLENKSNRPRIHLILDAVVPKYRRG